MPPILATVLCLAFIVSLFLLDRGREDTASNAILIPMAWMFFAAGRFPSQWLNLGKESMNVAAYAEGSPLDAAMFSLLIAGAIVILARRNLAWGAILSRNKLLCIYFLFCAVSIAWSEFPLIVIKRLVKDLGNPLMVIVILTERDAVAALGTLLRRLAYVWLPVSYLFSKYYPELGRSFHNDGTMILTGVGTQKNDLGLVCLIAGIYFASKIFQNAPWPREYKGIRLFANGILIAMLVWLLDMSDSQTSFACLMVAVAILGLSRLPIVARQPTRIFNLIVLVACAFVALESTIDLTSQVFEFLGRDPNLTDRVPIWRILVNLVVDPWFGAGYQSFWLGDRPLVFQSVYGAQINQAHNGYLEQYLNLGYVGVTFIVLLLVTALLKVRALLKINYSLAVLKFTFLTCAILYNYTEASFYGVNNMWVLLLIAAISVPNEASEPRRQENASNLAQNTRDEAMVPTSARIQRVSRTGRAIY